MVRLEKEEMRVKEQLACEHARKPKLWLTPGGDQMGSCFKLS